MEMSELPFDVCRRYINDEHEVLGSLRIKLLGAIRSRNLILLCSCSSLPDAKLNRDIFRVTRQIEAFFKKADLPGQADLQQSNAVKAFFEGEAQCAETNERITEAFISGVYPEGLKDQIDRFRTNIAKILGDFSPFLSKVPDLVRLTAGATSTTSKLRSRPFLKVRPKVVCTPSCAPLIGAYLDGIGQSKYRFCYTSTNRLTFVPKNWKTFRTIACEPVGNLPFQLAFDAYVKDRLKKFGCDLSSQAKNQEMSREGSIDNSLATIDLARASDSLSMSLMESFFPDDWLDYCLRTRSPIGKLSIQKGMEPRVIKYEKYASMGNGTTFPLETLVFLSAAKAVGSKRCSVYGDDIIIETELAYDLIALLRWLGFATNEDKTFIEGPFRESCGTDWYHGVDITPFYVRDLNTRKDNLSHLCNGFLSISTPHGEVWQYVKTIVEKFSLLLTPISEDTMSGIHIDVQSAYDRKLIRNKRHRGTSTYLVEAKRYLTVPRDFSSNDFRNYILWFIKYSKASSINTRSKPHLLVSRLTPRDLARAWKVIEEESTRQRLSTRDSTAGPYRRAWCSWICPSVAVPAYMYLVGDYLRPKV